MFVCIYCRTSNYLLVNCLRKGCMYTFLAYLYTHISGSTE